MPPMTDHEEMPRLEKGLRCVSIMGLRTFSGVSVVTVMVSPPAPGWSTTSMEAAWPTCSRSSFLLSDAIVESTGVSCLTPIGNRSEPFDACVPEPRHVVLMQL